MRSAPVLLAVGLFAASGCDLTARIAASETTTIMERASGALQQHWDAELVGQGMPGSILQLEGLYAVLPEDERLGLQLARAYGAYAWGWVEDEAAEAEAHGDLDAQSAALGRARLLYERARNITRFHLEHRDGDLARAIEAGPDALRAHLREHFGSRDDAAILFWTGSAWAGAIRASEGDPALVLQLGVARTFVERAVELDPLVERGTGLVFLAAMDSAVSESLGGNPEAGRAGFERALALTERKVFAVQLEYAQVYAVAVGDRALFITLLREIVDGGDPLPDGRLQNRLARRRAIRLLQRVDELF